MGKGTVSIPHSIGALTVLLGSFPSFRTSSSVIVTMSILEMETQAASTSGEGG